MAIRQENIEELNNEVLGGEAQETSAPASAPATTGKLKESKDVVEDGQRIIATLSEEERAKLGAKSSTLHFKYLLGLDSKKSSMRVNKNESKPCATPVGLVFQSDIDIEVPVFDILQDTAPTEIPTKSVKAGEEFILSYLEYMYLMLRDDYMGLASYNGDPTACYFSAKLPKFLSGKKSLPTPTANLRSGSIKETIVAIDEQSNQGGWVIKDEYKEKFGKLLEKRRPRRNTTGGKKSVPTPHAVAASLRNILGAPAN